MLRDLHSLLRSPAARFGSLALALGLAMLDGLWKWFPASAKTTSTPVMSARMSARLSMEQLYDRLISGDPQPVRDRIDSLRKELPEDKLDWNYCNVAHKMLTLMGLEALLAEGDLDGAKNYLIMASQMRGSPQLDTFGPNMLLAKALLEHGEFKTVELYLEHCKLFWTLGTVTLDNWIREVREHKVPDFGANIEY